MADAEQMIVTDPSSLTTAQLLREVNSLEKLVTQRMDAIERAVTVAHDNFFRVPTDMQKAVGNVTQLMDGKLTTVRETFSVHLEKFSSVERQFAERDVRTEQTSRDSKVAVDAALQAAKEAVGEQNKSSALAIAKSDAATTKQIDQLGTLIQSTIGGINAQIGDLKERLTRFEGEGRGKDRTVDQTRMNSTSYVGIAGLVLGSLVGLGGLLVSFRDSKAPVATMPPAPQAPQIIYMPAPPALVAPPAAK